jgi:hypothetical protein
MSKLGARTSPHPDPSAGVSPLLLKSDSAQHIGRIDDHAAVEDDSRVNGRSHSMLHRQMTADSRQLQSVAALHTKYTAYNYTN